ncbi:MAG: FAD-dependent oxidoreductase, partial [Owenweeksia sp.]
AFSPVGTLMDKIRMGNLQSESRRTQIKDLFNKPELTTKSYLKQRRFSNTIIDRFFSPFFGGIFLEQDLHTSSRMFEFIFKMMAEGDVAIPKKGMEEIPRQIKRKLRHTEFRFHTEVESISGQTIYLKGGETIECPRIMVASNPTGLIPQLEAMVKWQEAATYYFEADRSALHKNTIALNYDKPRLVNNFTVVSDTSPAYAPKKKHLVSVSLTHIPEKSVEEITHDIKSELSPVFGAQVNDWKFIRNYHIPKALPAPLNSQYEVPFTETRIREGLYLAGDHLLNGSLNAAIKSGELAAKAVVLDF